MDAKHDVVVLDGVEFRTDGVFGFAAGYDPKAHELAELSRDNFGKFEADHNIVAGGHRV